MPLFGPPNVEKLAQKRDTQALVSALHYRERDTIQKPENRKIRADAARALEKLGWQPPTLTERAMLAIWLKKWDQVVGYGPAAFEPLFSYYKEADDPAEQIKILRVFGQIGDPRALPYIETYLSWDHNPAIRRTAIQALCEIHMMHPGEVTATQFVRWFKNRKSEVKLELYRVLAETGGERAIRALMAMAEGDPELRFEKGQMTQAFILALSQAGAGAIESLCAYLDDEDLYVRQAAIWALGRVKNERAFSALKTALHSNSFKGPRGELEKAICSHGGEKAAIELVNRMASRDPRVEFNYRRDAAQALVMLRHASTVGRLIPFLSDERLEVRRLAAMTLGDIGDRRATEPLLYLLQNDEECKGAAEDALSKL